MKGAFEVLTERGFIRQTVYEEDLKKELESGCVPFYTGFDPTADSLHIGHFIPLMAMCHMQRAGHKPIVLVGGGTAMVGDPSGRTDMRSMMTKETIMHNCECFKKQMNRLLSFEGENAAVMVNNADWLWDLNYIDFLREVGVHFSVNRMLTAECFKSRMEKGLSFLEFNYMLMQGYDFLYLHEHYGCKLELGGDDQWSNMLAGVDLIRRKKSEDAYAMTFALLTNSEGKKMGKTAKGALWLDASRTSPFEFYQYFRNVDDADVEKCMKLLTFMELEEIAELVSHKDERINAAKARLAWEVTALIHGKEAADEAEAQAKAAFSGDTAAMEAVKIGKDVTNIVDILVAAGLAPSKGEARRLVQGGGVKVGDEKVSDIGYTVTADTFVVHKGKKAHVKLERE